MPQRFTRQEFSTLCNIPNNTLTILAKRGKLSINSARCIKCEKKRKPCDNCKILEYIDLDYRTKDGFYINLDFYKKYTQGIEPVKPKKQPPPPKIKEKPRPEISVPVVIDRDSDSDEEEVKDEFGILSAESSDDRLTRAKKFFEIQNKQADTRLKEITEAKLRGELMPVSDAKEMISIFAESTKRAYSDSGENVLMLVFEMCNVPENSRAMLREKFNTSINQAVKNSVRTAQARIESLENGN